MRYDQPFYVGLESKCRGVSSDGYLPALVPCGESQEKPDNLNTKHQEVEWSGRQRNIVQQLRAQVLYLQKRLTEHINKKPQKKEKVESRSGIEI